MIGRTPGTAIFAAALLLRLAFVLWAPAEPAADGIFYHAYGQNIARGWGYIDLDGSPVVRWMPGWPLLLGALYSVFGTSTLVAVLANAAFDAATAALVAVLGARLFHRRVGLVAGGLYAFWPGMVFLCATHMSEPLFNLLLVGTLLLTATACEAGSRRTVRFGAAGLCLGATALVKAEPLVMSPAILLTLWLTRRSNADFLRAGAAVFLATAAVLTPWTIRNYVEFDRFLPTAASGGIGVYLANHPGATGGQDLRANRALQKLFRRGNAAETAIARNDAGWRDAWAFVRANPDEELRIVANKLRITYLGDARGAKLVRGLGPEANWHVGAAAWRRLRLTADSYWFAMLALALVGIGTLRSWKPAAAPLLLLGVLAPWFCLHVVFLGGPRYHVPQIPALALLAACGVDAIAAATRQRRSAAPPSDPDGKRPKGARSAA
jgi:4-amino-4-deoxy-L-arabinose transferase-like glycosyltransferase